MSTIWGSIEKSPILLSQYWKLITIWDSKYPIQEATLRNQIFPIFGGFCMEREQYFSLYALLLYTALLNLYKMVVELKCFKITIAYKFIQVKRTIYFNLKCSALNLCLGYGFFEKRKIFFKKMILKKIHYIYQKKYLKQIIIK